jgi:hypothetical protein
MCVGRHLAPNFSLSPPGATEETPTPGYLGIIETFPSRNSDSITCQKVHESCGCRSQPTVGHEEAELRADPIIVGCNI